MRNSKPRTVTLVSQQASLDVRPQPGDDAPAGEDLSAGLRTLDREEAALNADMKAKIEEALNDTRPPIPADEVFERLKRRFARDAEVGG